VTELGTDRPDEAIHVLNLLNTLNPPVEAFNIVPALAVGGVAAVALSAALLNPQSQDNMREAANAVAQSVADSGQSATQQVSTSIEIWKYLFGTAFPVHLLDKENSKLSNPIANAQDANSSSGGYAAGDRPDSLGTTGGSGIAEQAPSGYSRPEEKLPASEVMYQDSADGSQESAPLKTAVQELEVDAYRNLKAREVVGDGLEHDHIPSFAALRVAKEAELGRPLTELETKSLYQNSTAVEVPRNVHIAGPTYGGKNNPAQIQQDAADLCGAICRDTEALRENLKKIGYDSKLVNEAIKKIVERNRNTGVIK